MTQRRSRTGGRFGAARGYPLARLAVAALLVLLAAAGLRGSLPQLGFDGPYIRDELPLAIGLEAVILGLLVAVALRQARARSDNTLAARLREVLRGVLSAAALVVPVLYLLTRSIHFHLRRNPRLLQPYRTGRAGTLRIPPVSGRGAWFTAGTVINLVLIALLVAAIVMCVLLWLQRRRGWRGWWPPRLPADADFADDDGEAELREAVEYGWLALRELDDARGAIIACYLAMEQSLARAGAPRGIAETPDELLARAAGAGLVRGHAAARLTSVFYEARFSTRQLTPAHRDVAEQALAELAASLAGPVTADAPGAGGAGAGAPGAGGAAT